MVSNWTLPKSLPPSLRMVTRWPEADQQELIERYQLQSEQAKPPEWHKSRSDPAYFIHEHTVIFNATDERWRPFRLWPAQREVLNQMQEHPHILVLKARQLGLTWLCLGYILWRMCLHAAATVGIFSRREEDAQELLDFRLKGMYDRLPSWAHVGAPVSDNKTRWVLPNGSTAMAFPTNGGRQYTFSLVLVDEADFQPDLPTLLTAVEPTIDAGGQMLLISSSNKDLPESRFKTIYRGAVENENRWFPIFLPWTARPDRDAEWYEAQRADKLKNTGALDDLHQEYPATDTEALAPRTLDKRIPFTWLEACYVKMTGMIDENAPAISGLTIYRPPQKDHIYALGVDPAEGNPTSDDSALTVLDVMTGEECAVLAGKFQPSVIAGHADTVGRYYNNAGLMVERNNHGHAVLLWLDENSRLRKLKGHDDKPGWLSSKLGKALLYNEMADCFKDGNTTLHSFSTYMQLASIEGATLLAPEGQHDDRADSYALAHVGRVAMLVDASSLRVVPQTAHLFGARERMAEPAHRGRNGRI